MSSASRHATATSTRGEPTWEISQIFPTQGQWSVGEYLRLPTNRLVEYCHGCLEFLPMPTDSHQAILLYLYEVLKAFVAPRGLGVVRVTPLPVRLGEGRFREPDLLVMLHDLGDRIHEQFWDGADLVMEVVSPPNPEHDWETKRLEYAQAGIPEYWIADPQRGRIAVLTLAGTGYVEHGTFVPGQTASSVLLPGFTVEVAAALHPKP